MNWKRDENFPEIFHEKGASGSYEFSVLLGPKKESVKFQRL